MKKLKRNRNISVEEPGGINVPQLIFSIRKNYLWFFVFGILGILMGAFYNFCFKQKFRVTTTLVVNTNNAEATLTSIPQQPNDNRKNIGVQNQVGILSSYSLNLQTLQNLRWNISWYKKSFLNKVDLYKNEPYKVVANLDNYQTRGIPIHIKPINRNQYLIVCDAEKQVNGVKNKIDFNAIGTFGKPFRNRYFNFTLNKINGRDVAIDEDFVFVFNDLVLMAQGYQRDLKIRTGDNAESNMIYIELDSRQAERAIDYLNELGNVYILYGLKEKNRIANNTVDFINKQIAGVSDSLKNASNTFSDYRSNNRIVDIGQQSTSIIQSLEKIENEESISKMKLDYFRSLKSYLNNASALKNLVAPSVVGVTDPSLNTLVVQLSELLRKREVLSYTAQDQSLQLITLNNEIAYTQKNLAENINNLLSNTELEVANLQQQKARINAQRSDLPKTEENLNNIKRDFDLNNELYTFLLKKRSEAQIAQASRDPDAKILDAASFGTASVVGLNRYVVLMLGLTLGLVLPISFLIAQNIFKKELIYVSDITDKLKLSIIGNILYNKFDNELPVVYYPHSDIAESFRGLRINIQYLLKDSKNKVIAIHSVIEGEGKSFVSANLAAILATNNKTVLLVDADLRKPRTYKIFNCSNNFGLSNYLQGEIDFNDAVVPTSINGLSIVNAGPNPLFPSELLNNGMLGEFVTEARKYYEYIIFNTPPASIVNDAMMIVPYMDMNIFLLRMRSSTKDQVEYINQLVQDGLIKNMGVVLNNVTNESYAMLERRGRTYYNDNRLLNEWKA